MEQRNLWSLWLIIDFFHMFTNCWAHVFVWHLQVISTPQSAEITILSSSTTWTSLNKTITILRSQFYNNSDLRKQMVLEFFKNSTVVYLSEKILIGEIKINYHLCTLYFFFTVLYPSTQSLNNKMNSVALKSSQILNRSVLYTHSLISSTLLSRVLKGLSMFQCL